MAGILFCFLHPAWAGGVFDLREQELLTAEERIGMQGQGASAFVIWGRPYLESLPKAGFLYGLRLRASPGRWALEAESVSVSVSLRPKFSGYPLQWLSMSIGYEISEKVRGALWIEPLDDGGEAWLGPLVSLSPWGSFWIRAGAATPYGNGNHSEGWTVNRNFRGPSWKWFLAAEWIGMDKMKFYVRASYEDQESFRSRPSPEDALIIEKQENRKVLASAEGAGTVQLGRFYGNFGFTLVRSFLEETQYSQRTTIQRILERRYHDGWEIRFEKGRAIPYIGERYFYYIESYQKGIGPTLWLRNGRSRPLAGLEIPWGHGGWFRGEFSFHLHSTKIFKYYLLKAGKEGKHFGFRAEFGLVYEIEGVSHLTGHLVTVWKLI